MKKTMQLLATMMLLASLAFAHAGAKHIMGTVTAIGQSSITLRTPGGQTVEVATNDKTTFQKSGKLAAAGDLKVGDRVVVEAHEKAGKFQAESVRFGASTHKSSKTAFAHH